MNLSESLDAEGTKRKNIIEMALGFTAMLRIFAEGYNDRIARKLDQFFLRLPEISNRDDYEVRHRSFCKWFTRDIRTAEKTLKNGSVLSSEPSSYGQAAKVLDIAIKVYVYYCGQPTAEVAKRMIPWLHGAIDTPILKHLKKTSKVRATTIKGLNEEAYKALQNILLDESRARKLHPVQYDDILWRRLNRMVSTMLWRSWGVSGE